jgi:hypothetical protein
MTRKRFPLLLVVFLLAALSATCGDSPSPLEPVIPATGSFEIEAPASVYAEQPFTVTVMAVATDGTRPDPDFNGSVSLSASAGTVAPASLTLVNGVGTGDVTLSGQAGSVNLTASAGGASGSAVLNVVGTDAVARIEVTPSAFLLTEAGQTRQLEARAYDAQGRPTQASIVWQSSHGGTITVGPDGRTTAVSGLGSAQIVAMAGGVVSAPVLGLVARPVDGAMLVDDANVVSGTGPQAQARADADAGAGAVAFSLSDPPIVPVDTAAEYELGWQYRVTLTGIDPPEVGSILLGSGEAPIGGRVVAVEVVGSDLVVTLELVALDEMFADLSIDQSISLEHADVEVAAASRSGMDARRLPGGSMEFVSRRPAESGGFLAAADGGSSPPTFDLGPFTCKFEQGFEIPITANPLVVPSYSFNVDPSLSWDLRYNNGWERFVVRGGLEARFNADPRWKAQLEAKIGCDAHLATLILPIGGPLALLIGGQVKLGVGLNAGAKLTVEDVGYDLYVEAGLGIELGFECPGGGACGAVVEVDGHRDGSFKPVLPDLGSAFEVELSMKGSGYAKLVIGNKFFRALQFETFDGRAGLRQTANLKSREAQASDPDYASDFKLDFVVEAGTGPSLGKLLGILKVSLASARKTLAFPLSESPKGSLQISPASVRAGTAFAPGEKATFTVALDPVVYFPGVYAVEAVQIRWWQEDGDSGTLGPGPSGCSTMPASNLQVIFECEAEFGSQYEGTQTFYAFVQAKLFGVVAPVWLEVGKSSRATLTVVPADGDDPAVGEGDGRGSSWGDPHLITPDGRVYDFMAVGDYLLVGSTDPGDDFEVQVRYRQPDGDEDFSWNEAVAMNVLGDIVEVYAKEWDRREIVVNGDAFEARNGMHVRLEGGGAISVENWEISVSWPDRSLVHVKPTSIERVLAAVDVHLPEERRGRVEGLLGNFDGNPANDLRIRNGAILQDPSTSDLYMDFRQSWRIPFGTEESLFSQGSEQFDPRFPFSVVSVADLDPEDREWGREACQAAGVLDPEIMNACIVDVVLTGDTDWAYVAAGVDPRVLGVMVSPPVGYIQLGDSRQFGAVVTGTSNRQVTWTVTGGMFTEDSPNVMTYMAPEEPGVYTLTATLVADPSHTSSATVYVSEVPTGFSKQWAGMVDDIWSTAANWIPVGVPDSTDNVYIPTGTVHGIRIMPTNVAVNDLWIEPGAIIPGSLRVWGNADVHAPSLWVYMMGEDRSVRGRLRFLDIQGSAFAAGPVTVEDLYLTGGTFRPAQNRIEADRFTVGAQNGGRLVMVHASDHLVVDGAMSIFNLASSTGSLTAGTLEVGGNIRIEGNATIFEPSGSHRLVLNGSAEQLLTFGPGRKRLHHVEFANPSGVVGAVGSVHIHGTATVSAGRFLVTSVTTPVYLHGELVDAVDGGWQVARTMIMNPEPRLPERMTGELWIGSWAQQLTVNVALQDDLELDGDLVVELESFLRLNGHTLRVNGNVATRYHGSVVMGDDADRLIVSGNAAFGDALFDSNAGALFSAGVFEIAGNLFDNRNQYKASGSHRTVLNGTDPQTVSLYCYFTNCFTFGATATTGLHDVDIRNPAGVTFVGRGPGVTGTFLVDEDAAVTFETFGRLAGSMDLRGALTLPQDLRIAVADTLFLRGTATLNNHGQMDVSACEKEDGHTINGTDPCP